MRETLAEWFLLGITVLIIGALVFGTMYTTVNNKTTEMNTTITSTNLP